MPHIEPGYYKATPTEYKWCYSSKGTKSICVRFEILDAGNAEGVFINWHGYFSEKAWERTIESLRYMGFEGDDLTEMLLNKTVQIVIENEEYEGKMHSRVRWVNSLGQRNIVVNNPMNERDLREFAAAMSSRIAAINKQDDIPF